MNRSLKLGRIAGIYLFVHWTFLLLLAWVFLDEYRASNANLFAAVEAVGFILSVFVCVTLHELGHALAARQFGIRTRDITLLPIGGVARLERMPEKPGQELIIAVAGPMVNVIIAALLLPVVIGLFGRASLSTSRVLSGNFLFNLLITNVLLVVFNLIPAFPMDGGRVLRALLAFRLNYVTATRIAARIGQLVAVCFAAFGIWNTQFLLVLVAAFVFMAAQGELQAVRARFAVRGLTVRDAGIRPADILNLDDPVAQVAQAAGATTQPFYAVADGDRLGVTSRADLLAAAADGSPARVRDVPRHYPAIVKDTDLLESAVSVMNQSGVPMLAVTSNGRFAGFVPVGSIARLIQERTGAVASRGAQGPAGSRAPADGAPPI